MDSEANTLLKRDGPVFKTNLGESSTKKALRCSTSNNVSGQDKGQALTIAGGSEDGTLRHMPCRLRWFGPVQQF